MIVYLATYNSDQTEGKGYPMLKGIFRNEEDAVASIMDEGVMGVGTGDVYSAEVLEKPVLNRAYGPDRTVFHPQNCVWGYHKRWNGKWGYGWIDNRDAPSNDPEYAEYLRLKEKFNDN